ncbi:glycosyltransferase [Psychrobacter sp. Arc29]|uniref:glycosyltransferase n=1 Tax=Psychrobacter sp. Arc29 TaxID=3046690 RepID=UPI00352CAB1B
MALQRVLHIVGKMDRAGAETMLMNLYRHIDHTQIQFDFVTFTNEVGDYDEEINNLGGKIIPILAKNPIERMVRLRHFLRNNPQYEIVHSHMLLSNAFHLLASKYAGIKHRISHSHNTSNGKSGILEKVYEKWAILTNRQIATYKIACGKSAANYLFGNTKEVLILPNAVDIQGVIKLAKESQDYIREESDEQGIKIIQVGRLNEVKNHQFSLKIAQALKSKDIAFTMYIAGQGSLYDILKQQVADLSLMNNVKFLGVRTDITELMASADYMIMPSLHEGFPVVLVESQSVGLKALVSDQVSKEVDLRLELVDFLSIDSVEPWVSALSGSKYVSPSEEQTLETLKSKGFDASTNAQILSQVYKGL